MLTETLARPTTDIRTIKHVSEQQTFLCLQRLFPNSTITHEPKLFELKLPNGTKETTIPDFYVELPDENRFFLETTLEPYNPLKDPKEKQKRIMAAESPDIPFIVWYKDTLDSLTKKYPDLNFYNSPKFNFPPYTLYDASE